ncbi:MAG: hypothetical protein NTZ97_00260 [Candidatus Moranbacteria bacterium]|nr:hypothetical protein [Candidatus Moranbacteria bacterium]
MNKIVMIYLAARKKICNRWPKHSRCNKKRDKGNCPMEFDLNRDCSLVVAEESQAVKQEKSASFIVHCGDL